MDTKKILQKLKENGDCIHFNEEEHVYHFKKKDKETGEDMWVELDSVTTSLSRFSSIGGAPSAVTDWPIRRGNLVHSWTEVMDGIKYGVPTGPLLESTWEEEQDIDGYVVAWGKYIEEHDPKIIACEQRIAKDAWKLAGTLDRIAFDEDTQTLTVIDIKTGKKSTTNDLQMIIYMKMLKSITRFRGTIKSQLVYVTQEGSYEVYENDLGQYIKPKVLKFK